VDIELQISTPQRRRRAIQILLTDDERAAVGEHAAKQGCSIARLGRAALERLGLLSSPEPVPSDGADLGRNEV